MMLLLLTMMTTPYAPYPFTACVVTEAKEADLIAKEVDTIKDAVWCVVLVDDCKNANLLIYKDQTASTNYVVSASCR